MRFHYKLIGILLLPLLLITACTTTSGYGYSYYDRNYFQESPYLVLDRSDYKLQWIYGDTGFYFTPECNAVNQEAHCSLQATTSTGSVSGKLGSIDLDDPDIITAIDDNKIYWVASLDEKVLLEVRE